MKKSTLIKSISLALAVTVIGCSAGEEFREVTAERLARPAFMVERDVRAQNMDFKVWERMHERYKPANVYIEGDGYPLYLSRTVTNEPTPENPVALHLASRDLAKNLVYIGRPCHFKESPDKKECDPKYWSTRRFSPEVFTAYNEMLDQIKKLYDITEFNLIGYAGGANIAAGLASQRSDVISLRTVAGNLSPELVYAKPPQPLDNDSILANRIAPQLANMPQHHFVGAGDEIVPASVYHSYRNAMGESDCVHYTFVPDADHQRGWVERWPEFLQSTVACESDSMFDKDAMKNYVPQPLPPAPDYNPNK